MKVVGFDYYYYYVFMVNSNYGKSNTNGDYLQSI